MGRGKTKTLQASIAVTAVAFSAAVAYAQTPNSPLTVDLSFSTSLEINTNPGLSSGPASTEFSLSEELGFSFLNETSLQMLEITGETGFALTSTAGGGSSVSVESPMIELTYSRESANSDLQLNSSYWRGDVTSAFDADPTSSVFLIVDTGTLVIVDHALEINWGLNAPIGFSLYADYAGQFYDGTTDAALFDSTVTTLAASANVRFSSATTGSFTAFVEDDTSDDLFSTNSLTNEYTFQVDNQLASGLLLSGNAGYRDVSTTASGATTTESGFFAGVDLTQPVSNGTYFGGVQFDGSESASSTAVTLGRSLDLVDGLISASVTADTVAGAGTQFLGTASYLKELSDGNITVDFSQTLTENSLDEDVKLSTFGIGYLKNLNSNSDLSLTFDFSRSEDAGVGAVATLNRSILSASYSRELTPSWGLSVGYAREQSSGSAISSASSDSVFLTLTKDIQFGF